FTDRFADQPEHLGVERSGKAPVAHDGHEEHTLHFTWRTVDAFAAIQAGAHITKDRSQSFGIRPHTDDRILGTAQFRRAHHFHGGGDLLGAVHRNDPVAYLFRTGHVVFICDRADRFTFRSDQLSRLLIRSLATASSVLVIWSLYSPRFRASRVSLCLLRSMVRNSAWNCFTFFAGILVSRPFVPQ